MEVIAWRQPKLFSKHYVFGSEAEPFATLTFPSVWRNDAIYTSGAASYFLRMRSSLKNEVDILEDGKPVADVRMPSWGKYTLRLPSGRWYTLASDMFSNSYRWLNEVGEELIWYSQGLLEVSHGTISVSEKVPAEDLEVLLGTGLFLKQNSDQMILMVLAILFFFIISR